MKTLKGAEVSAKIREQVTQMMGSLEGPTPKLTIVRVGEKPDDMSYERGAVERMENFDLRIRAYAFPEQISDGDFEAELSTINRDPDVSGILLLCPLPKQIAEIDVEKVIDPEKGPDGTPPANIARVFAGDKTGFALCTAETVIEVLRTDEIDMTGKNVIIVGRSMMAGRPLPMLMLRGNATVTICRARTRDLEAECRRVEILVAAAGKAKMLGGHHVGQDIIVIDTDINMDENGKIYGDMDLQFIEFMTSTATPMPGGVGTVTTAVLAKHSVPADQKQRRNQTKPLLIPVLSSY